MKMKVILILFAVSCITNGYAQECQPLYKTIQKDVSLYRQNDDWITSLVYKIENKNDETIWLWIDKNDVSGLSNKEKFKKYFNTALPSLQLTLLNIGFNGELGEYVLVPGTFIKRIYPYQYFQLQIIGKGRFSEQKIQNLIQYLDQRIVFMTECQLNEIKKGITEMRDCVFYKPNLITLYDDMLK